MNVAIQYREELLETPDFAKVGLGDWSEWSANLVLRDENWILGKEGWGHVFSRRIIYSLWNLDHKGIQQASQRSPGRRREGRPLRVKVQLEIRP